MHAASPRMRRSPAATVSNLQIFHLNIEGKLGQTEGPGTLDTRASQHSQHGSMVFRSFAISSQSWPSCAVFHSLGVLQACLRTT